MTVQKLRPQLSDYLENIVNQTIEGVGIENDDLVILLANGTEICVWSDDDLNMTINQRGTDNDN